MSERKIKVTCDDVTLQLTLSTKLLAKPFEEAVLKPFLKAYSKKAGEPADLDRVARVEVDENMLGDHRIPASVVLLANETVEAEVFLRPLEVQEQLRAGELSADPFAPLQMPSSGGSTAAGRTVHAPAPRDLAQDKVDFDEDNLTPVERLKKERREAREARERLEAAAAASAVLHDVSDDATPAVDAAAAAAANSSCPPAAGGDGSSGSALAPGMRVRVEGLTSAAGSQMNGKEGEVVAWRGERDRWEIRLDGNGEATVNVKPANLVPAAATPATVVTPAAPVSDGGAAALKQLEETGDRIFKLGAALDELEKGVRDVTADGAVDTDGSFRAAARQMLSDHMANLNKLMMALDEVSLGEVTDERACHAARGRKKSAAAQLEGSLLPKARALQKLLEPPPPPPPPPKQSAEIDSDED